MLQLLRNPRALLETLRGSLLFLPGLSVISAVVLALVLVQVRIDPDGFAGRLVFTGGADGARGLLQAVTGSVITVTSLTFSLTVVTLQLASSQFSPRLLRNFLRDRGTQTVLSLFLATAAYGLLVLRTIRSSAEGGRDEFVPYLAVSVAVLLALACIFGLVYFLDHITSEIRVDSMLRNVTHETRAVIDRIYPAEDQVEPEPQTPVLPLQAVTLLARRTGFVQALDLRTLSEAAVAHDACVQTVKGVGDQIIGGTPLAYAWPLGPTAPPVRADALEQALDRAATIGFERTIAQDIPFGFRQLVDVASKALSPGVNDPTTADPLDRAPLPAARRAGRAPDGRRRRGGRRGPGAGAGAAQRVPGHAGPARGTAPALRLRGARRRRGPAPPARRRSAAPAGRACADRRWRTSCALVLAAAEREVAEPADLVAVRAAADGGRRRPWPPPGAPGGPSPSAAARRSRCSAPAARQLGSGSCCASPTPSPARSPRSSPPRPGVLSVYACGPTVYRYAHVGNLRTFLLSDLIGRVAERHGLRYRLVQNITDVGHMQDDSGPGRGGRGRGQGRRAGPQGGQGPLRPRAVLRGRLPRRPRRARGPPGATRTRGPASASR